MRDKKKELLSVIIPAYKKGKTILRDLDRVEAALEHTRFEYEIVCVVDGKEGTTYRQAKKNKSKKIKVVAYSKHMGKGYAVRYGMARTRGNLIAFIDAGLDINPKGLPLLLEHMLWYGSDIIVGSIRHSASRAQGYPMIRTILSWGYHTMTKFLFGLRITDCQRGIKIYKRKVLEKVLPRLLVKKFAFDIEILAVANNLGFTKIHDGPVEMDAKKLNYSTIHFETIFEMLWNTLAVFYRLNILRYYDDCNKNKWLYDKNLNFKSS